MRQLMVAWAIAWALVVGHAAPAIAGPTLEPMPQREPTPAEKLDKGRKSFRMKDWEAAAPILKDLLYPESELNSKSDVVEVYLLLGACYFELGNREKAAQEFKKALELDFDRGMTELTFSAGAIRVFDDTKADVKIKLDQEAERRRIAEYKQRLADYINTIGVYETNSFRFNFIGFGAGQFQNKQPTKGWIVGISQFVTMGVSLGCFFTLATKYGVNAKVPLEDGPTVRLVQQIEIASGVAFYGIYAYSVIDGMVHYKPSTRIRGDDALIRDLELDGASPRPEGQPRRPAKTSLRDRLRIGPVLVPGGAGLAIGWETD